MLDIYQWLSIFLCRVDHATRQIPKHGEINLEVVFFKMFFKGLYIISTFCISKINQICRVAVEDFILNMCIGNSVTPRVERCFDSREVSGRV